MTNPPYTRFDNSSFFAPGLSAALAAAGQKPMLIPKVNDARQLCSALSSRVGLLCSMA